MSAVSSLRSRGITVRASVEDEGERRSGPVFGREDPLDMDDKMGRTRWRVQDPPLGTSSFYTKAGDTTADHAETLADCW